VTGKVSFDRLHRGIAPELAALGDGRGRASGQISVELRPDTPLAIEPAERLELSITRQAFDAGGRAVPSASGCATEGALHVVMTGDRVRLDQAGWSRRRGVPAGGRARGTDVRGVLAGHLDLDLLQPIVAPQLASSPVIWRVD